MTYATTVREMKATFYFGDFTIDFILLLESFQLHTYNIIVQWLWEWFGGRLGPSTVTDLSLWTQSREQRKHSASC